MKHSITSNKVPYIFFRYIVEREKGLKCPQFEKLPDSAPFSRGFKVFLF